MKIFKSAGPNKDGIPEGHCYDGTGWVICDFWKRGDRVSHCTLFGVDKSLSRSLVICDKVYGVRYEGRP